MKLYNYEPIYGINNTKVLFYGTQKYMSDMIYTITDIILVGKTLSYKVIYKFTEYSKSIRDKMIESDQSIATIRPKNFSVLDIGYNKNHPDKNQQLKLMELKDQNIKITLVGRVDMKLNSTMNRVIEVRSACDVIDATISNS
jgi:hypothetical protein